MGLLHVILKSHEHDVLECCDTREVTSERTCKLLLTQARIELGCVDLFARLGILFKQRTDLQGLGVEYRCEFSAVELYSENMIIGIYRIRNEDIKLFLNAVETKLIILVNGNNVYYMTNNSDRQRLDDLFSCYNKIILSNILRANATPVALFIGWDSIE